MEIILSPRCKSFTGTISRYHGYAVRQSGKRFFSYRTPGKYAKPDGHWQFIVSCAEIAKLNFHIADIKVTYKELKEAIVEAKIPGLYLYRLKDVYDADDILTIKSKCGL
jgi:hypothetical protein